MNNIFNYSQHPFSPLKKTYIICSLQTYLRISYRLQEAKGDLFNYLFSCVIYWCTYLITLVHINILKNWWKTSYYYAQIAKSFGSNDINIDSLSFFGHNKSAIPALIPEAALHNSYSFAKEKPKNESILFSRSFLGSL